MTMTTEAITPDTHADAIARAEEAVAALSESYVSWAESDTAKMRACVRRLTATPGDPEKIAEIFRLAHDMKGQGATFGYPLLTEIAGRLCHLVRSGAPTTDDRIAAHVAALADVVSRRLRGDGGKERRRILATLGD